MTNNLQQTKISKSSVFLLAVNFTLVLSYLAFVGSTIYFNLYAARLESSNYVSLKEEIQTDNFAVKFDHDKISFINVDNSTSVSLK